MGLFIVWKLRVLWSIPPVLARYVPSNLDDNVKIRLFSDIKKSFFYWINLVGIKNSHIFAY